MMRRAILVLLLVAGCAGSSPSDGPTSPLEISQNPAILHERKQDWAEMTLNGHRLGDDATRIPHRQIREQNAAGWIVARDGSRYRVQEGRITGLGVWDQRILRRLDVPSRDAIDIRFGTPETVEEVEKIHVYTYAGGHVRVLWSEVENRIAAVNVVR